MVDIIPDDITSTSTSTKTLQGKPDVVILLDESGSMLGYRDEVISTFNEYVQSVRKSANSISLFTFESDFSQTKIKRKINKNSPSRVKKLTERNYSPFGGTPLYDAMGTVISSFYNNNRPVQFVVHTDGQENSSREYSLQSVNNLIKQLEERGWLFIYLGEGIAGKDQMSHFSGGVKLNYDPMNRVRAFDALATTTTLYNSFGSEAVMAAVGSDVDLTDKGYEELKIRLDSSANS